MPIIVTIDQACDGAGPHWRPFRRQQPGFRTAPHSSLLFRRCLTRVILAALPLHVPALEDASGWRALMIMAAAKMVVVVAMVNDCRADDAPLLRFNPRKTSSWNSS